MREEWSQRTAMLLGEDAMHRLSDSRVAVFGLGGVGGYAVEALARSGVGTLYLIDHDRISESNLNRQILALQNTIGQYKVDVAEKRIREINPDAVVCTSKLFFMPETASELDFSKWDYIVDAIDTVTGKLHLVEQAQKYQVPIISSMGTGNKLDPSRLVITDLSKTAVDPLARIMRKELKKRGIFHLKVVYSEEKPLVPEQDSGAEQGRRTIPGSTAWVPAAAGLLLASEVVRDLTGARTPEK